MTLRAPMRCSAVAEQLDEPMIGTVEQRTRWLLIEDRSLWGADAVKDVMGAAFAADAKARGVRVLLVRRREGDPAADAVRRTMLVDTSTREAASWTIEDPSDLRIDALAGEPVGSFGPDTAGPIFLVCTNGKRDACCALRGRALMTSLAAEHAERTWECTHLGGHRFAGNLVCLPDAIVYGRVGPDDGPRLADAYLDGRLDPRPMRGRSAWPRPAQVAERELRLRLGLLGVDDVRLGGVDARDDHATVGLLGPDDAEHRLELVAERADPERPTNCRGDELEAPVHWRVIDGG